MSDDSAYKERRKTSNRPLDIFVVLFCVTGAAVCFYLFYQDLFSTIRSSSEQQAGTVVIKQNTVQRRLGDRAVWDRLFDDSPVYNGDVIRVARLSGAELNLDDSQVELGENTLIRIQKDSDSLKIEFFSGEINIAANKDGLPILLTIGDRVVEAAPGAVFSASSDANGTVLRVTEGNAQVKKDGKTAPVPAGSVIIQDTDGNEVLQPAAAVISPRPNARFIKTQSAPMSVDFSWTKMNIPPRGTLKLEISEDRNFSRVFLVLENLDTSAKAAVNAGLWHWRLSYGNNALSTGRITITEAVSPVLFSPAEGQIVYNSSQLSQMQFRWSNVPEAVSYMLQVSRTPDFNNPDISLQAESSFCAVSTPGIGKWHWRVLPIFPSGFDGSALFSSASSFMVEKEEELTMIELKLPANDDSLIVGGEKEDFFFTWAASNYADYYTFIISPNRNLSNPAITKNLRDNFYVYRKSENILAPGVYYWSVTYTNNRGNTSPPTQTRTIITAADAADYKKRNSEHLFFSEMLYETLAAQKTQSAVPAASSASPVSYASPAPESKQELEPSAPAALSSAPVPAPVTAPAAAPVAAPAPVVRPTPQPAARSASTPAPRPTASAQAAPSAAQQALVSQPETLPEAKTQTTQQLEIKPGQEAAAISESKPVSDIAAVTEPKPEPASAPTPALSMKPFLPAPKNMLPVSGYRLDAEQLRQHRNITFSWSAVEGANAYILTVYKDNMLRPVQVFQTEVFDALNYTFDNLRLLDNVGTYTWQLEAISYNKDDIIDQRGKPGESKFVLDVPRPGRVRVRDMGVLYGTE